MVSNFARSGAHRPSVSPLVEMRERYASDRLHDDELMPELAAVSLDQFHHGITYANACTGRKTNEDHPSGPATVRIVFGDTPNIAARVQAAAEPDTVLITATTQRLVAGLFVVEERGAQQLKGVPQSVDLYRVVQPRALRSLLEVSAGRHTPFIGRQSELGALSDAWERVVDGTGQTVLVQGEPGLGKSRLCYQLREQPLAEW